jgi:anthranilate phosphoribosyltransferase
MEGLDEISTTGPTRIGELEGGQVRVYTFDPEQVGVPRASLEQLHVSSVEEGAAALKAVLSGERGPRRDIVLLNAAATLLIAGAVPDWQKGLELAAETVDSGKAAALVERLVELSARPCAPGE